MRPSSRFHGLAAAAVLALAPLAARADLPFGHLAFIAPTGTATSTEPIDVWVRFTLDPTSAPLTFSSNPLTGFAAEDLPAQGYYYNPDTGQSETHDFASYDGAFLNTYFGCSGTFTGTPTNACGPSENYEFQFWTSSAPGRPSINFLDHYDLAPGASVEYLFGVFKPAPGGAASGAYVFYDTGLTLNFTGVDALGNPLTASVTMASTCAGSTPDCAFTRAVTAVPEPASWALMAAGIGVAGLLSRRRGRILA